MNKLFSIILSLMVFFMFSCDSSDDTSTGPPPEPPLIGCEAAEVYDWDTVEFETSLNGGANTWIAFSLEELTLFSVVVNQAGFQCTIFNECNGEFGLEPYVFQFETVGNGLDIGIVPEGGYWINILNTRPNRMDFTFRIELSDIAYGCIDDDALNYNELANVDDGSCTYQDCNTDFYLENHPEGMVLDCDGNCAPIDWIGDGWCDDGAYGIYNEDGELIDVNLICEEFNWDEGDCEAQPEGCTPGLVEDCNGICGPEGWLGDGFCDDGQYSYNGNPIFFNCEEFDNDNGDCDLGRVIPQQPKYPNGRVLIK